MMDFLEIDAARRKDFNDLPYSPIDLFSNIDLNNASIAGFIYQEE